MDQFSHLSPASFGQQLLYNQPGKPEEAGIIFPASNEFDWAWFPWTPNPVDVVIGFGTNASWDVAIRHGATALVLGDWQPAPLYGQEFLLRPLILLAKNRQEFLSFLCGIPIPPDAKAAVGLGAPVSVGDGGATSETLVPTWVYLGSEEQKLRRSQGGYRDAMKAWKKEDGAWKQTNPSAPTQKQVEDFQAVNKRMEDFEAAVLGRVKSDTRFGPLHLEYVKSYLEDLRNYTIGNVRKNPTDEKLTPTKQPNPDKFGPFEGKDMGDNGNLWLSFQNRYSPNKILTTAKNSQKGVSEAVIKDNISKKDFSCFSSEASFQHLQKLFGLVHYVLGSMYDPLMYQAIQKAIGVKSYLIFGSNIIDVTTFDLQKRKETRESFLSGAAKFLATDKVPLLFQQSMNPQIPHGTEDYFVTDKGEIKLGSSYPPQ